MELNQFEYYFNRELGWLEFNGRVVEEAQDRSNPLMERFKFLAITASNLDEFFMVRVSALLDQVEAGYNKKDASGLMPKEQLSIIASNVGKMLYKQYNILNRGLLPSLEKEGIIFAKYAELSKKQKEYIKKFFDDTVYPILTPMAIDQSRPFPLLANKSLNILLELVAVEKQYAVVQVPSVISRIIELPYTEEKQRVFILLEDVIKQFIGNLFEGYHVKEAYNFRITRNSDFSIDEEDAEDLLIEIERSLKRRKWGEPVRLELEKNMPDELRKFLVEVLEFETDFIYEISGYIDLTVFMQFSGLKGFDHLKHSSLLSQAVPAFMFQEDIFSIIREKDILVHHPYESFDCVVKFVTEAARDPQVLAIKQTLYRVSGNSPIVQALIEAAENGKQVTVLVELKARFDEENNILWARKLEKSGCHVVYGLVGLKTHCKICLVVRNEEEGIRRYVHLGTGNYNDSTARIYTDLGLFTAKEAFGADISALFNSLTGYSLPPKWKKISVAPNTLKKSFLHHIENEAKNALENKPAKIIAKMNSLVDVDIIEALYKASMAGVEIRLIVRGICCLKAGIKNISENITVISIVDRFLEHSRIFYFENNESCKIFLSSADWMPRNLIRRVEVMFPVEQEDLKERIKEILSITLSDTVKARVQNHDGTYERIDRRGKESIHSQLIFHNMACEAAKKMQETNIESVFL